LKERLTAAVLSFYSFSALFHFVFLSCLPVTFVPHLSALPFAQQDFTITYYITCRWWCACTISAHSCYFFSSGIL